MGYKLNAEFDIFAETKKKSNYQIAKSHGVSQRRIEQICEGNDVQNENRKPKLKLDDIVENGYVYRIEVGKYVYIGQTTRLPQRMEVHLSDLRNQKHHCAFMQYLYNSDSEEVTRAFKNPEVLEELHGIKLKELLEEESRMICKASLQGENVLNAVLGDVILAKQRKQQRKYSKKQHLPKAGGIYRHYKGHMVMVTDTVTHTETMEKLVTYRHLKTNETWARPLEMWNDIVTDDKGNKVKRFTLVI